MHSLPATDTSVVKFRGATYDAAVEAAQLALGPRVKVVAANRIRRGGIGGFFATELGVEVSVALHDETVDQALERLVEATAEEDRSRWFEQLTSATHATAGSNGQVPGTVPANGIAPQPAMTQLLTARTIVGDDTIVSRVAVDTAPPSAAEQVVQHVVKPVVEPEPAAVVPKPAPGRRRILLPTKGHVDLAVAAAAELARLTSEQLRGRRIAVHVVVTSDDGRSVEADAIIEESS
jgi:hypothetical protein